MSTIQETIAAAETVEEAIGLGMGAASSCWEDLSKAGVFQSEQAESILEATVARVNELTTKENQ
jgi:hypothetical protein